MSDEKISEWRCCPYCGYGPQMLESRGNGVEIYICLNCKRRIPTPIDITVVKKDERIFIRKDFHLYLIIALFTK
jgi:tRNA(Ile2) C34 agmatinyltransferase TiaS